MLARLLHAEGRYDQAVSLLDRALALDPANNEARVVRSVALNDSGDWSEALAEYDRVLACDPNHAMALVLRCVTEIPVNYATEEQILNVERRSTSLSLGWKLGLPALTKSLAADLPRRSMSHSHSSSRHKVLMIAISWPVMGR